MGQALLVVRLAIRNIRRHPVEAVLLVLAIMAATTTLTVGRALDGVTNSPYERTRAATAGPDVVASVGPDRVSPTEIVPVDATGLDALADDPAVADHSGPYPVTAVELGFDGITADVWAQGRDTAPVSVEQPKPIEGGWVEDGGAVVESAFADVLGVEPGDRITLDGRSFRVVGVAGTAASAYTNVCFGMPCGLQFGRSPQSMPDPAMPSQQPGAPGQQQQQRPETDGQTIAVDDASVLLDAGLVWLTEPDARALAPAEETLSYVLNLRLHDTAQADAFVDRHPPDDWRSPFLASSQDIRSTYDEFLRGAQGALTIFGGLLTVLAVASVAVLVGGRMADQTRRVGLLKAVGATPAMVAVVLLAEYVVLALAAAAAGLAVGWRVAPLLSDPGAGLIGGAGAPALTVSTIVLVTSVALGAAVAASLVSAVRAARTSTVQALADSARRPRRTRWLVALSSRLPTPLLLGLRVMARRPRRVVLGVASIAVTVSGIVALQAGRAAMAADWDGAARLDPQAGRANQLLDVITALLVVLAAVNAIVITWAAALDSRQAMALSRALGATPRQVSAGLSAAQVLPALAGALLGIAGGLLLWAAIGDEHDPTYWQLAAVIPGTVLIVAGLTSVPARLGARRSLAAILQTEHT